MTQLQRVTSRLSVGSVRKKLSDFGVAHLAIFGSYARSEQHKESDLDILLDLHATNAVTLGTLEELEIYLKKELAVPKIDFVFRRSINPRLRAYIEKDIIEIF